MSREITAILFAFALPKRVNLTARLYRRCKKVYVRVRSIKDVEITMNGTLVAGLLGLFAGPVICFIIACIFATIIIVAS